MAKKPTKEEGKKAEANAQQTPQVQLEGAVLSAAQEIANGKMEMSYAVSQIAGHFNLDPEGVEKKIQAEMDKVKSQAESTKAAADAKAAADEAQRKAEKALVAEAATKNLAVIDSPRAFKVRLNSGEVVDIKKGTQQVSPEVANHWYCKQNGVKVYG